MTLDLTLAKRHLNVDADFHEDDAYILALIQVAKETVQRNICALLDDMADEEGNIPAPLQQAILIYMATLYASREAVTYGGSPAEIPLTYQYLISLYKNYSDTTSDTFVNNILDDLARATLLVDEENELKYGEMGNIVITNELERKAIERIANHTEIDENGNYMVNNIKRI